MIANGGGFASWFAPIRPLRLILLSFVVAVGVLGAGDANAVKTNTSTALTASPTIADVGQLVSLTATVTPSAATGIVTFKNGSVTLGTATLRFGVAYFSASFSTTGPKSLTAVYGGTSGGNGYNASTSLAVSIDVVLKAVSSTNLGINPTTVVQGQSVSMTATVTGSNPTGNVAFCGSYSGPPPAELSTMASVVRIVECENFDYYFGSATLVGGVASLSASLLTEGTQFVTARYGGDAANKQSSSNSRLVTVNSQTTSTTTLTSTPNPSSAGQSVVLTAAVAGASPTGIVTFRDGATPLGSVTLTSGMATLATSFATVGVHSLSASYGGDTANSSSTSTTASQTVNAASTSTHLAANPNPATEGRSIVLTAVVSGGAGVSGNVSFSDGARILGTAPVSSDQAILTISLFGIGAHSLTADYVGDANNNASSSSALSVQVTSPTLPAPPTSSTPVINYEYDAQGNSKRSIQAPGFAGFEFTTVNTYDTLNRRKDTTDARLGLIRFSYNGREDLTQITDPRNLVTRTLRNGLGDIISVTSPDTGVATLTYDQAGNLLTRTDSRGVLASFTYDALSRPTSLIFSQSGQTNQAFGWDYDQTGLGFSNGVGRLTSTAYPGGSTQYSYDAQGRVLIFTQRVNATAAANPSQIVSKVYYEYDNAGQVIGIGYPSGRKLSISYTGGLATALSLAKDSSSTASPLINAIQWEPFGTAKSWVWQMATDTLANVREFDSSGRMVRYRLGGYVRDLTFDAADRISSYIHLDGASGTATAAANSLDQSFGYDQLGRLTTITTGSSSWSIGYDANGNRTAVTLNGVPSVYTTAVTSNRLTATSNPARGMSHDSAGNTLSDSGQGYSAIYDLAGRLETLTKAGLTTTHMYDAHGKRVRKFSTSGAASTVVFVYDQGGQLLGEYNQSGTAIREYVWLGSTPVAVFAPDPADAANPPLTYYIHADHLDTPRVVVDNSNAVRWRWMAEPFGTSAPETNPSGLGALTQNLRFPGQFADVESGLIYNYFRNYDPSLGRYTQSDPIGLAGGINTYAYAEGNPVSKIDPTGELAWFAPAIISGGIAAYGAYKTVSSLDACVQACAMTHGDAVKSCSADDRSDIVEASAPQRINDCKSKCAFGSVMGQLLPKYNILKPGAPR